MTRLFLIVFACMAPDFSTCHQMSSYEYTLRPHYECQLDRPYYLMVWQDIVEQHGNHDWLTFTRCRFETPEQRGEEE